MPSTRQSILHENVGDGVDTSTPAHLIGQKWRVQHNMRLTPTLKQIPQKVLYNTVGTEDILDAVVLPSGVSGYGRVLLFTPTKLMSLAGTAISTGLTSDSGYHRWSKLMYNGSLIYGNDLNVPRSFNGASVTVFSNAPKARYLALWYDHLVAACLNPSTTSSQLSTLACSHLYNFNLWTPDATNEADTYDFVEWQQPDYPFIGITGIGKLGGTLWVYTPTAIIPVRYVGLPKLLHVDEDQIVTRAGNTFPWTLVCLDRVHFFYDGVEGMFFAFNGAEMLAIGEPVRGYLQANLNTDLAKASKMYGFVDIDNREIWWPFISTVSSGAYDKAVVFNYRYKKWFTASVEDVKCFIGGSNPVTSANSLAGTVNNITTWGTGTVANLGIGGTAVARLFGSATGKIYREEVAADAIGVLVAADVPILESADFHYGDIRTTKENDLMLINATYTSAEGNLVVTSTHAAVSPDTGTDVVFTTIVGRLYKWVPVGTDRHLHNGTQTLLASGGTQYFYAQATTVEVNSSTTTSAVKVQGSIATYANGRNFLGGDVTWAAGDLKGYWDPTIQDAQITYPSIYGRVLRYRFEGHNVRFLTFSAFSDGTRVKGAEK